MAATAGCGGFASRGMNAEGVRMFDQARYQEAARQFQQSIFSDPSNPDGYYNLAATYHRLGSTGNRPADLTQAERYYNQCLDRAPDHSECHRGLAVLLMQQGRRAEAFRLMEGWADHSPGLADPKIELARLLEETGEKEPAKQHLIDALKADQRNPRALAALGRIREQTGETHEAALAYQRSLSADHFQPGVRARLATLRSTLGPQAADGQAPGTTLQPARSWQLYSGRPGMLASQPSQMTPPNVSLPSTATTSAATSASAAPAYGTQAPTVSIPGSAPAAAGDSSLAPSAASQAVPGVATPLR